MSFQACPVCLANVFLHLWTLLFWELLQEEKHWDILEVTIFSELLPRSLCTWRWRTAETIFRVLNRKHLWETHSTFLDPWNTSHLTSGLHTPAPSWWRTRPLEAWIHDLLLSVVAPVDDESLEDVPGYPDPDDHTHLFELDHNLQSYFQKNSKIIPRLDHFY